MKRVRIILKKNIFDLVSSPDFKNNLGPRARFQFSNNKQENNENNILGSNSNEINDSSSHTIDKN